MSSHLAPEKMRTSAHIVKNEYMWRKTAMAAIDSSSCAHYDLYRVDEDKMRLGENYGQESGIIRMREEIRPTLIDDRQAIVTTICWVAILCYPMDLVSFGELCIALRAAVTGCKHFKFGEVGSIVRAELVTVGSLGLTPRLVVFISSRLTMTLYFMRSILRPRTSFPIQLC